MSAEVVHLETGRIATITLDSPENRNALSSALMSQLDAHLERAIADDSVRVIVLTHTGTVFCSGADLKELNAPAASSPGPNRLVTILTRILDSPKPMVARLAGPARAGGLGLVAACDISVAVDTATFAFSEVRVGVIPAIISVVILPKVGPAKALELFLTGDPFSAADAVGMGLINAAVPGDNLDEAIGRFTRSLLKGAPAALAGSKRLIHEVPAMGRDEAFEFTARLSGEYFSSEEAREGMAAFAQKRPPRWAEPA
jgi:methylglutaconyl-CoA hydratase